MIKKKLPKRKPTDPRGGFFKLYSEKWLNDKNALYDADGNALDRLQAGLVRVLSAVNEVDFQTGQFNANGYALPRNFIESLAKITPQTLDDLINIKKIKVDENGLYSVVDWEEFQDKKRLYGNYDAHINAPLNAHSNAPVAELGTVLRREEGKKGRREEGNNLRKEQTHTPNPTPSASPQAIFIDWYKIQFQSRFGKPYADSKPDYIQIASTIKQMKDIELIKRLVMAGWNTPDEKNFSIASCCMTVKGFCSVINRITLQKPKPKTAYEMDQERIQNELRK